MINYCQLVEDEVAALIENGITEIGDVRPAISIATLTTVMNAGFGVEQFIVDVIETAAEELAEASLEDDGQLELFPN